MQERTLFFFIPSRAIRSLVGLDWEEGEEMMRRCVSELARRRRPDRMVSFLSPQPPLRDVLLELILMLGLLSLIDTPFSCDVIVHFHTVLSLLFAW